MKIKIRNIAIIFISIIVLAFLGILGAYFYGLPKFVSNQHTINYLENFVKKDFDVNLKITAPTLKTTPKLVLELKVKNINLSKNNEQLLNVDDINTKICLKDIFKKRIIVQRLSAEAFYADVNKLLAAFPQQENKKETKFDWDIDIMDALLYVRNVDVSYNTDNTKFHILSKGFGTNNARKINRRVYFKILVMVTRNNETMKIGLWDQAKVFINNETLYIKNLPIIVNGSFVYINAKANKKIKYDVEVYSKKFNAHTVEQFINSNLVVPKGKELLASIANKINGSFGFNIKITPQTLLGTIRINRVGVNIIPLKNLPVTVTSGKIKVDNKRIVFENFKGYYRNSKTNSVDFAGDIKDYTKSMQTNIIGNAVVTDSFMKYHMTKLVGAPMNMLGKANTRIKLTGKNNKFDFLWLFQLLPNNDILFDHSSLSSIKRERVFVAKMHFEDMMLNIKSIDYVATFKKDGKEIRKSIMNLVGNVDCKTGKILDIGLNVPDPLPSEFFNLFLKQKFFKKGHIAGKIHYINTGVYPFLDVDMKAENIKVPSQRLKIEKARMISDKKGRVHIVSKGKFKKAKYKIGGNINNKMVLPIVVNNIEATVDNLDIQRVIKTMNQQNTTAVTQPQPVQTTVADDDDDNDDSYIFNTGLLIINDCNFHMISAKYKDIKMGNLDAHLTLDKNGLLKIKSNKFDFAEGISTLKVQCDLIKHNYYLRLGVKDVNSDLIASNLLGMERQISGKAKGLIEFNTDDSLKLNGKILFDIDDGTIGTVGFLEYVLKFVALFRNPLAMLSPSTLIDLVNIPKGEFDCIKGELVLKDNVIMPMKIKSRASQLSSFIIGKYDLEKHDAILRVYTKISNRKKGFAGFMRALSLNTLAKSLKFGNTSTSNAYALEVKELPAINAPDKDCQIFLTKIDGDIEHNNYISSLKRIR